jgi:4-methylaminobutanoate oxidase (formaldehyde-forming)
VGEEHRATREGVTVFDQTSFAKFEVTGEDAAAALSQVCAGHVERPPGRVTYTQLLNSRGGIEADLTVARLAEDRFYIVTGTGFRTHDYGWIADHLAGEARIEDVTEAWGTLSLMGPRARDVLAAATEADVSDAAFPFAHVREIAIAGQGVRALRITYVGELGWELHVPVSGLVEVYGALMAAGAPHGIRPAGYRAIESLRLEKGYRAWSSDITPNDTPFEAGLGWAVKMRSNLPFLGREALERTQGRPLPKRLAGFAVEDPEAVLLGRETILRDGVAVGYLTSGGFGYTVGKALGYGYVRNADGVTDDFLASGRYELVVAGDVLPARLSLVPFYDPEGRRIRA